MPFRDQAWLCAGRGDLPDRAGACASAAAGRPCPAERGRLELSASLLFTRNSNPGKSVEDSTWAGRVRAPLGPDARFARPAGRYREVSPLTVRPGSARSMDEGRRGAWLARA